MKITLSEGLKQLLMDEFLTPVNHLFNAGVVQNPNANGLHTPEARTIKNNHRNIILNQGRTDFEITADGLTPSQKIDLYCYYYFQMHFTSSYRFYFHEKDFLQASIKDKTVWFIDIGCGPFTSGLAFNSWLKNFGDLNSTQVNYIGVDTSPNMLLKAETISKNCKKLNYGHTTFSQDKNEILDVPQFIAESQKELLFILNYSYLFASNSLVVQDFIDFTTELFHFYCNRNNQITGKVVILQQNPRLDSLNEKWAIYKAQLPMFNAKEGYPQLLGFNFDDCLGSSNYPSPSFNVRCDLLKSF